MAVEFNQKAEIEMKILIFSGSRAEFDLLSGVLILLRNSSKFEPYFVISGAHLSEEFGGTLQYILDSGFEVNDVIATSSVGGSSDGNLRVISETLLGASKIFQKNIIDLVIVLGDRFETFAVAQAALFHKIPILHLCGGDLTEGAIDEALRHSISKMAQFHCVTNENSRRILLQLGEDPNRIWNSGSLALDAINEFSPLLRDDFLDELSISDAKHLILVTFHPPTWSNEDQTGEELFKSLEEIASRKDVRIILTGSNADVGGTIINKRKQMFANEHSNAVFLHSLGRRLYFNALHHSDVMVGNSSSAFYEAPSFGLPCVNIGDRQKGRIKSKNIISCENNKEAILKSIRMCLELEYSHLRNPYGEGKALEVILDAINSAVSCGPVKGKTFYICG